MTKEVYIASLPIDALYRTASTYVHRRWLEKGRLEAWRVDSLADSCPLGQLVDRLPIPSDLPVEDGVLVARHHLVVAGHVLLPSLDRAQGQSSLGQGLVESGDDGVDRS